MKPFPSFPYRPKWLEYEGGTRLPSVGDVGVINGDALSNRRTFLARTASAIALGVLISPSSYATTLFMSDTAPRTPSEMAIARRVKAISNVFEVGSVSPDYAYAEELGDGRGLTLTQYGLVTNELEVGWVIELHQARRPNTMLARFLPVLPPRGSGTSMEELKDFAEIWRQEIAEGSSLVSACDAVADRLYFEPALEASRGVGLKTPVGLLIFYDTLLQHGGGDDPDSFGAILERAVAERAPSAGGDEKRFLKRCLAERRAVLLDPHNAETADVWRRSVKRVDALETLLERNPVLRPPVIVANSEIRVRVS